MSTMSVLVKLVPANDDGVVVEDDDTPDERTQALRELIRDLFLRRFGVEAQDLNYHLGSAAEKMWQVLRWVMCTKDVPSQPAIKSCRSWSLKRRRKFLQFILANEALMEQCWIDRVRSVFTLP